MSSWRKSKRYSFTSRKKKQRNNPLRWSYQSISEWIWENQSEKTKIGPPSKNWSPLEISTLNKCKSDFSFWNKFIKSLSNLLLWVYVGNMHFILVLIDRLAWSLVILLLVLALVDALLTQRMLLAHWLRHLFRSFIVAIRIWLRLCFFVLVDGHPIHLFRNPFLEKYLQTIFSTMLLLLRIAQGRNPFLIEEFLRSLIHRQQIRMKTEHYSHEEQPLNPWEEHQDQTQRVHTQSLSEFRRIFCWADHQHNAHSDDGDDENEEGE